MIELVKQCKSEYGKRFSTDETAKKGDIIGAMRDGSIAKAFDVVIVDSPDVSYPPAVVKTKKQLELKSKVKLEHVQLTIWIILQVVSFVVLSK